MPVTTAIPREHPMRAAWERWMATADGELVTLLAGRSNLHQLWQAFSSGFLAAEAHHGIAAKREFDAVVSREIENREA